MGLAFTVFAKYFFSDHFYYHSHENERKPDDAQIKQEGKTSVNPLKESFGHRRNMKMVLLALFGGLVPFLATLITTIPGTNYLSGLYYPMGVATICFIIGTFYLSNKIDKDVIDDANEYFGAAKIETVGNKIQS